MAVSVIEEPIKVAAVFEGGKLTPVRFRWRGRAKRVRAVTGRWTSRDGTDTIHHFAIMGDDDVYYEISFSTQTFVWRLEKLETE
jgi:hypothetical protein